MKKLLWMILAIFILAAAFYAYRNSRQTKVDSLESITPQEVIYYISSYNLGKKIEDFQANVFAKQVTDNALFKQFVQPQLDTVQKQIPFLSEFLERDAAAAIYSLPKQPDSAGTSLPVGDILVLLRVDAQKNMKLKKTLADFYLSVGNKTKITHKNYRGIKISEYKLNYKDMVISCAFLSDVVLIGNNKDIIKKSIDIYRNKSRKNLLNNDNFKKLAARIKKDSLFWIFADNRYYYQEMLRTYSYDTLKSRSLEDGKSIEPLLKMKPFMDMMNIFSGYVSYVDYDRQKEGFVAKIYQAFDKDSVERDLVNVIAYDKALDKDIIGLGLENAIVYYGGSQDLMNGWKLIRKFALSMDEIMRAQVLSDPKYSQYKDQVNIMSFDNAIGIIQSFLGIDMETDIFPVLGNNFGMVFAGLNDVNIEPGQTQEDKKNVRIMFPAVYAFVELKDNTKMQKTMEDMTQRLVDNINRLTQPVPSEAGEGQKAAADSQTQGGNAPQPQDIRKTEEPAPKLLAIKTEDYNGVALKGIEISNPRASFLRPTYCILGKYIIFSLTQDIAKKVVDMYTAKTNSFADNPGFQAVKDKALADYSNLLFFDLAGLIANIRASKTFIDFESGLADIPQVKLSKESLDSILDILSNIETFVFTNKVTEPDIIETDCYLKVKGL